MARINPVPGISHLVVDEKKFDVSSVGRIVSVIEPTVDVLARGVPVGLYPCGF